MRNITLIGIDLAKNNFQVCAMNKARKVIFNKKYTRKKLIKFMSKLEPTIVVMEACGTSNYWGRRFESMGHTVKLVPTQYVKQMVRGNKNDKNDVVGISETYYRPNIHFVPIKSVEQADIQMIHKTRSLYMKTRTATSNQLRAFLAENGIICSKKILKQLV